jgi:hypothetical protein
MVLLHRPTKKLSKFHKSHDELYTASKQLYARRGFSLPVNSLEILPTFSHFTLLPLGILTG